MATYDGRLADEAFITLATNDGNAKGALVLAESLRKQGTTRQVVVMITPQVSSPIRSALGEVFDAVRLINVLDHCWTFTKYRKCVFMHADMMALQNIDDLFEREVPAAPDSGLTGSDVFYSGLFVFRPPLKTFNNLLLIADNEGSFDGGDQAYHLPFLYNLHVSASYDYLPAFSSYKKDPKVVHFLGPVKPWHHSFNKATGQVQLVSGTSQSGVRHFAQYLNQWWAIYNEKVEKYFPQEKGNNGKKEADESDEDEEDSDEDNDDEDEEITQTQTRRHCVYCGKTRRFEGRSVPWCGSCRVHYHHRCDNECKRCKKLAQGGMKKSLLAIPEQDHPRRSPRLAKKQNVGSTIRSGTQGS